MARLSELLCDFSEICFAPKANCTKSIEIFTSSFTVFLGAALFSFY